MVVHDVAPACYTACVYVIVHELGQWWYILLFCPRGILSDGGFCPFTGGNWEKLLPGPGAEWVGRPCALLHIVKYILTRINVS